MKLEPQEIARNLSLLFGNREKKDIMRPAQVEAYRDIRRDAEAGHNGGMVERPTGTGKTVLFGMVLSALEPLLKKKSREEGELNGSLILVPTRILAEQTKDDLVNVCHLSPDDIEIYRPENMLTNAQQARLARYRERAGGTSHTFLDYSNDDSNYDSDDGFDSFSEGQHDDISLYDDLLNEIEEVEELAGDANHAEDEVKSRAAQYQALNGSRHLIMTYAAFNSLLKRGLLDPAHRPVVIADEADLAKGPATSKRLHEFFNDAYVLGFTATDRFVDPKGKVYSASRVLFDREGPIHRTPFLKAVENKEIAPTHGVEIKLDSTDDGRLNIKGFIEFSGEQLREIVAKDGRDAQAIEKVEHHFAEQEGRSVRDMQQIWFCHGIEHAKQMAHRLNNRYGDGYAVAVSGQTPKDQLRTILKNYKAGKIKTLVNAELLIRGFNAPNAELCVMMSPTRSPTKLAQCAGRVTRLDKKRPDKQAYIVNFLEAGIENTVTFSNVIESERFYSALQQASPDEITSRRMVTEEGLSPATHKYVQTKPDVTAMLISLRERNHLSQNDVANILLISRSLYSRLERTGEVPAKYRGILAGMFKIKPGEELTNFLGAFSGYYGKIDPKQYCWEYFPVLQEHFGLTTLIITKTLGINANTFNQYVQAGAIPEKYREKLADLFELAGEQRENFRASLALPTYIPTTLLPMAFPPEMPKAELLLELRRYHGYSMRTAARELGMDAAQYWLFENGRSVPKKYHVPLANIFRIPPGQRSDFYRIISNGKYSCFADYAEFGVTENFDYPILTRTEISTLGAQKDAETGQLVRKPFSPTRTAYEGEVFRPPNAPAEEEKSASVTAVPAAKVSAEDAVLSGRAVAPQVKKRARFEDWNLNDVDWNLNDVADTHAAAFLANFMRSMSVGKISWMILSQQGPRTDALHQVLFDGHIPTTKEAQGIADLMEFVRPRLFFGEVEKDRARENSAGERKINGDNYLLKAGVKDTTSSTSGQPLTRF